MVSTLQSQLLMALRDRPDDVLDLPAIPGDLGAGLCEADKRVLTQVISLFNETQPKSGRNVWECYLVVNAIGEFIRSQEKFSLRQRAGIFVYKHWKRKRLRDLARVSIVIALMIR